MVIALMTLYQPEEDVLEHIAAVAEQVDLLYLCDNSKVASFERFGSIPKTKYLFFNENRGLSKAFNSVLKSYPFSPEDYIIFFDQDSTIHPGHIAALVEEYEALGKGGIPVGCIGPIYFERHRQQECLPKLKKKIDECNWFVPSLITSSMMCKYRTLQSIDFWNEEVFLDLADIELCWRVGKQKQVCVITHRAVLEHSLGNDYIKVASLTFGGQNPVRDYYQTRDVLYLLGKSYAKKRQFLSSLVKGPILRLLFLKERRKRLHMIIRGWMDWMAGKHGEFVA